MKRHDKNGDGKLDEAEALNAFGWTFNRSDKPGKGDPRDIAAARAKWIFPKLDKNNDGFLSASEAHRFGSELGRIDSKDPDADAGAIAKSRADAYIESLDKNGDGTLSAEEVRYTLLRRSYRGMDVRDKATGKGDGQVTAQEISRYLERREPGRDGKISQAELENHYATRLPGRDGSISPEDLKGLYGGYRNGRGDGPRGTPSIDGDRVYTEGGTGDITCLEAATGKVIWQVTLADLGGRVPGWGFSESPLVEGDLVIITPGGSKGTLAALDKNTGKLVWQSDEEKQPAHYSSPVAADIGGIRQIVQLARQSCFAVTADKGRLLWKYSGANNGTANVTTPIVHNDHVFVSSSYGTGGGLARISAADGKQKAEQVYFEKRMANHHGGIVKVGDCMYGFGSGGLICMEFMTGKIAWSDRSVSKGSLVVADGMLYLLGERQQVALAEATHLGYKEHGRFSIPNRGFPSWAHPVVTGGRFYIRDQQTLTAYDVRAK